MFDLRTTVRKNYHFIALLLAFGLIRTAVADYNPVPSGSMHPTILEGDVVLVNRLAYDLKLPMTDIVVARLGEPARGDIVTFSSPQNGVRLIKRIIGLPGDIVTMRDKKLVINGRPVDYLALAVAHEQIGDGRRLSASRVEESLGNHPYAVQWLDGVENAPDFGPVAIPADQFLMLGDNRDNSADSRYFGLVRRQLLVGRASRILVSADITGNWLPRFARFGSSLYEAVR